MTSRPTWTQEQLQTFLAATKDHRYGALWRLMGTAGLRIGEASALRWRDVDFTSGRIPIERAMADNGGDPAAEPPKYPWTAHADRVTIDVLRTQRARQNREKAALGGAYDDQDLVTAETDGTPVGRAHLSFEFRRQVANLDLPAISMHQLRYVWMKDWLERRRQA